MRFQNRNFPYPKPLATLDSRKLTTMKPFTKHFIKIFLQTGITFGIIMTLFDFYNGREIKIWKVLFNVLFFGFWMASFFTYFTKRTHKKKGITKLTNEILSVNQLTEIISDLSIKELIEKLKNDTIFKAMNMKEIDNGIIIKSGISLKSWGEKIQITETKNDKEKRTLIISSKPKLKTTLVDFGQNKENIDRVVKLIKNVC